MVDNDVGSIVVVDPNKVPLGIFTERDLVKIIKKELNIDQLTAKDEMSSPIKN